MNPFAGSAGTSGIAFKNNGLACGQSSSLNFMTQLPNAQSTPYHRAHHRFTVLAAGCVFLLIVAGALVTSNDAGLSVPDWPTSFGSLYRIPPLVGGVKFEHGHRMLAEFIGLLTIGVAVWTQKVDQRRWMRILGWSALGTVIAQGMLGGLTVLFYLPPAISTAHATLAQTFFCIMVSIAFFTSRSWVAGAGAGRPSGRAPPPHNAFPADRRQPYGCNSSWVRPSATRESACCRTSLELAWSSAW